MAIFTARLSMDNNQRLSKTQIIVITSHMIIFDILLLFTLTLNVQAMCIYVSTGWPCPTPVSTQLSTTG